MRPANNADLNKEDFAKLLKEAGIFSQRELARILGVSMIAVSKWNSTGKYPQYIKTALLTAVKARKYDEIQASRNDKALNALDLNKEYERLTLENASLKKEISFLNAMKKEFQRRMNEKWKWYILWKKFCLKNALKALCFLYWKAFFKQKVNPQNTLFSSTKHTIYDFS